MSNNRLSFSQVTMYNTCSQKYKYYYIDKLREKYKSAALLFGDAIDKAIGAVCSGKSLEESEVEFIKFWTENKINDDVVDLRKSTMIVYSESDFDEDVLELADANSAYSMLQHKGAPDKFHTEYLKEYYKIKAVKKQHGFDNLSTNWQEYYNYLNWLSLKRKGLLFVKEFYKNIYPKFEKIISVQEKIELENDEGDSVIGFADLIVKLKDGPLVCFDVKTSGIKYEDDSARTSPQLTLYYNVLKQKYPDLTHVGFIVFRKRLEKNKVKVCSVCGEDGSGSRHRTCPKEVNGIRCGGEWKETVKIGVDIQFIVDKITERVETIVMQQMEDTNRLMKTGIYTRNFKACKEPFPCPYYNLCYYNNNKDLTKKEEQ